MAEVCGTCGYNRYCDGDYSCGNKDSEYYGCSISYSDSCDEWEDRDISRERDNSFIKGLAKKNGGKY